jgi:hypothetical protein
MISKTSEEDAKEEQNERRVDRKDVTQTLSSQMTADMKRLSDERSTSRLRDADK